MDFSDSDNSNSIENIDEENFINNKHGFLLNYNRLKQIFSSDIKQNICKIKIELKDGNIDFTNGFFCYIPSKGMICLITNSHIIDKNYLDNKKEINYIIENNDNKEEERTISLKSKRFIISNKEIDTTIIEILDEDNLENFFEVDEKFIQNKELKYEKIFSIYFKKEQNLTVAFGRILDCSGNFIKINIGDEPDSFGSPIITIDGMKIIGLHRGGSNTLGEIKKQYLGVILDKIIGIIPKENYSMNNNVIKCTYYIKKEDINKDINVYYNSHNIRDKIKKVIINGEEEDKENLKNGIYRFNKEGKYFFCYHFDNTLNDLSHMFSNCSSLTWVFIPSFSFLENKITNLSKLFYECFALKKIHFSSSFNTEDVMDMSRMFTNCQSLKSINLSSFNTKNVQDMSLMFDSCNNLEQIDLSSFNTRNVCYMSSLFDGCTKLKYIDLSSFNTEKVKDMSNMFHGCSSLKKLNLSNFKICNLNNMKSMFGYCSSLKEIDLTSFQTNEIVYLTNMFKKCSSLKSIKCNDKKINDEFEKLVL